MTESPEPRRFYPNDRWVVEDSFGSLALGDQVARMALEVDTPFTIGVIGKWGSGKTSVLRRAFATLGGKPISQAVPFAESKPEIALDEWQKYNHEKRSASLAWPAELSVAAASSLCVWYSPWQHQGAANPLVPLLLEIRAQFDAWTKAKKHISHAVRGGLLAGATLLERATDAAAALSLGPFKTAAQIPIATGTLDAVARAFRPADADLTALSDGQRFQLLFEDAVETLLRGLPGAAKHARVDARLIVFIDDLDRCEEATIVQLLESLKLYLSSRQCVFVLGLDDMALLDALRRKWPGRSHDSNRDYLDKLFQAVLPVPLPRTTAVRQFVNRQLASHGLPGDARLDTMLVELLEPNPRKVKNFTNSLCAQWTLVARSAPPLATQPEEHRLFARRFVLFHYLRLHHKDVWRLLERQPWALRVLTATLTNAKPLDNEDFLGLDVDPEQQRLLRELFSRAFGHVLGEDQGSTDHHRRMPLADAVEMFQQRIDRKRSDEHFVWWYRQLVSPRTDLEALWLSLPGDMA